jgi:hypothetical protein
LIGYRTSVQAKGVADMTADNHRPVQPNGSPGDSVRLSAAALALLLRQHAPGPAPVVRAARAEPSWGRVLLTTVELWLSRRLRRAGFLRGQVPGRRSGNRVGLRSDRPRTARSWRFKKLALAVVALVTVALGALQLAGAFPTAAARAARPSVSGDPATPSASPRPAAAAQSQAAAWIARQVSSAAIIGCYPALCASLQSQGVSASRLVPLGSQMTGLLGADVVATLPSADMKVVGQYAPALIASFGSGASRIEIRAVAAGGAGAYQSALRADLQARKSAGSQLLRNPRLRFAAVDASRLAAGEVDSRLLATLAALSSQFTLRVTAFGDSSPGAPLLFREVTIASDGDGNGAARLAAALALVNAQETPYLPAHSAIARLGAGQPVLLIEFASPSPLGLLTTVLTADVR